MIPSANLSAATVLPALTFVCASYFLRARVGAKSNRSIILLTSILRLEFDEWKLPQYLKQERTFGSWLALSWYTSLKSYAMRH